MERECGELSVFTRISVFRDWIDAVLYDAKFCTDKEGEGSLSSTTSWVKPGPFET